LFGGENDRQQPDWRTPIGKKFDMGGWKKENDPISGQSIGYAVTFCSSFALSFTHVAFT